MGSQCTQLLNNCQAYPLGNAGGGQQQRRTSASDRKTNANDVVIYKRLNQQITVNGEASQHDVDNFQGLVLRTGSTGIRDKAGKAGIACDVYKSKKGFRMKFQNLFICFSGQLWPRSMKLMLLVCVSEAGGLIPESFACQPAPLCLP